MRGGEGEGHQRVQHAAVHRVDVLVGTGEQTGERPQAVVPQLLRVHREPAYRVRMRPRILDGGTDHPSEFVGVEALLREDRAERNG